MDITLDKIDTLRERAGLSYKEAKDMLEKHNGSVLDALIELEEGHKTWGENISSKSDVMMEKIKEVVRKGNVTKIVVKKDDNTIMNITVTAGAIGAVLALPATVIGLTAAIASKCTIEITKEDGEVININNMAEKTVDKVKKAVNKDNKDSKEDMFENMDDEL